MTSHRQPRLMSDDDIAAELETAQGARAEMLNAERRRRIISMDGDIGRRQPRL